MTKMKKGIVIAVSLLLVGLMSACTLTIQVDPEDINAVGSVAVNYLTSRQADSYVCPYCGAWGTDPYYEEPCEGMAYREEPPVAYAAAENEPIGMANPLTEYSSLEEINQAAGTALVHPAVMGVTDESFFTLSGTDCVIADYDFTVVGYRWCFRAGAIADRDISGVYINGAPAFAEPKAGIEYAEGEGYKLARWFTMDGQYVLAVEDHGEMEHDIFSGIAEELKDMTDPAWSEKDFEAYYAAMAGIWQDEIAQRATMTVTADGSDCVHIGIEWGNGYAETYRWTMTGRVSEDGLLYYKDCTKQIVTFAEDGTATETTVYENGEGFFSLSPEDGKLYWNGAAEEECAQTVFVRVPDEIEASPLVGYWYDNFSERAVLTVEAIPGSEQLRLQVNWASSAFEDTVWVMTGTFDEATGRLSYTDCEKTELVLYEDSTEEATVRYTNGCGYFQLTEEGFLAWDGAPEGDCRACVFALAVG